jgi:dephospho-CoA kinase
MSPIEHTIIGIIGLPASGKGTIAEYLKEKHGAEKLRFSSTLNTILERLRVEQTRDNLIILSEVIRELCGEDVLARAILIGVQRSPNPLVVIDGVRRQGDIEIFHGMKNFHLLAVDAEPRTRYERSKMRAEKSGESTQTFDDFMTLEHRSTEVSARELMGQAEILIDNNGSIENLYRRIDEYIQSLDARQ